MIRYYKDEKIFKLDTRNTSYVFKLMYDRYLVHLYYGASIVDFDLDYLRDKNIRSASVWDSDIGVDFALDQTLQEYPFFGTGNFGISGIKVKNSLGNNSVKLIYKNYKIQEGRTPIEGMPYSRGDDVSELQITLTDKAIGLDVILYYDVYYNNDVITRHVELKAHDDMDILKASSLVLDFRAEEMEMLTLPGNYALERIRDRREIGFGKHTISSIRGITSHDKNPFLIIMNKDTNNDYGNAYAFNLIYSGDFKVELERNQYSSIRVALGLNDDTFSWYLEKDHSFTTPEAIMTFSEDGINGITNLMHKFIKEAILPKNFKNKPRPVLVNTWEGSCFAINSEKVKCYGRYAKKIGADMVVLDDGWFGRRNDDTDGLGDWYINKEKFPKGIDEVIEFLDSLGLGFGIWVEPEMVNPKSDLYHNHPEWVLGSPNRALMYSRSQYVLDLSNPEVREFIKKSLDNILSNHNIKYIKWDMNRPLSDVYSRYTKNQMEVRHRYVLGLYEILSYINKKYPDLLIESCAGGGGRFDLGILSYSPYIWTSDNTSPFERALIQDGTSIAYPVECMSNHVTTGLNGGNQINTSLDFRYQIASLGALGYELDFKKLSEEELLEIKKQIKEYKLERDLLFRGRLYRLLDPVNTRYYAAVVVDNDKSKAILKVNQLKGLCNQMDLVIRLKGLNEESYYSNSINNNIITGKCLMRAGFRVAKLDGDGHGQTVIFEEVN